MKYLDKIKNNKHLILAFCVLLVLSIIKNITGSDHQNDQVDQTVDISTHIPKGYVLLPMDFENSEQLKSLIQNFGYIDLYMIGDLGKKHKVAEKLKILRAPYNPNVFALLVKESVSEHIMKLPGPFEGAVQNNQAIEERIITEKPSDSMQKIDIHYYKSNQNQESEVL